MQRGKKKKRIKIQELEHPELWDNFKRYNIYVIEIPEGEERENNTEEY